MSVIHQFFWLFVGLWCGVAGGFFLRRSLLKLAASGALPVKEATTFSVGFALWVLIPSLILFLLQWSLGAEAQPMFTSWPAPQKYIAYAVLITIWVAMFKWVILGAGAHTLSRYANAMAPNSSSMQTPLAFKLITVASIFSAFFGLFIANP